MFEETPYMTAAELSVRWCVSTGHLANLRSAEIGVSYFKLGGRVLYRKTDVVEYENNCHINLAS